MKLSTSDAHQTISICNTVQQKVFADIPRQWPADNVNAKLAALRDEGWPFPEVEVMLMREGCGKACI